MKTHIILVSVIMMSLLPTGCSDDNVIDIVKDCGPYSEPVKMYDSEVVDAKFQENMEIDITLRHGDYSYKFVKKDGDSVVFHFIRYFQGEAPDLYYKTNFLFQVPENTDELYMSSNEFKLYNVFFRTSGQAPGGFLTYKTGCIQIKRIDNDRYNVDVNITYDYYPSSSNEKEVKTLTFTDVFTKGPSYQY